MKNIYLALTLALSLSQQTQTVKVTAAGNLRFVIDDIKEKYALVNPKAKITVNLGASGALV